MKMALGLLHVDEIDVIVMLPQVTIKVMCRKWRPSIKYFCNKNHFALTNKWKIGHTFGASGNVERRNLPLLMLQHKSKSTFCILRRMFLLK